MVAYRLTIINKHWYRVTIKELEQDKVDVFCIDNGVTKKVEKKLIQELPYKEKDMTKVFRISLKGVRIWYGRKVPESNQKSPRNIGVQGEGK